MSPLDKRISEEDIDQPLPPPQKPNIGFGGEKLKAIVIPLIVTIVVLMFMSLAGGIVFVTKKDFDANWQSIATTFEQEKTDLAKAKSDVANAVQNVSSTISTQISNGVAQATTQWNSQLSSLTERFNQLYAQVQALSASVTASREMITALETRVAELENGGSNGSDETVFDTTRWTFQGERIVYYSGGTVPSNVFIRVEDIDPNRIDDEGLYEISLVIWNDGDAAWAMGTLSFELVLEPRDYVVINEDDTYLDSDSYPWLDWDADFSIRTREEQDVCRRITFVSDRHNFNQSLAAHDTYPIELVLELYYD